MYQHTYRLTLYNVAQSDEFLIYDFSILPFQSDTIELCDGYLFEVKSRCFQPTYDGRYIHVKLHGIIINRDKKDQKTWKKLKETILMRYGSIKISKNSIGITSGNFVFPETLD